MYLLGGFFSFGPAYFLFPSINLIGECLGFGYSLITSSSGTLKVGAVGSFFIFRDDLEDRNTGSSFGLVNLGTGSFETLKPPILGTCLGTGSILVSMSFFLGG